MIKKLQTHQLDVNIFKTVGVVAATVGAILVFTPASPLGIWLFTGGTATAAGAAVGNSIVTISEGTKASDLIKSTHTSSENLRDLLVVFEKFHKEIKEQTGESTEISIAIEFYMIIANDIEASKLIDVYAASKEVCDKRTQIIKALVKGGRLIRKKTAETAGEEAAAAGKDAVAAGEEVVSAGEEAVAAGEETVAAGEEAVAAGEEAAAADEEAVAAGEETVAAGEEAEAAGEEAAAAGEEAAVAVQEVAAIEAELFAIEETGVLAVEELAAIEEVGGLARGFIAEINILLDAGIVGLLLMDTSILIKIWTTENPTQKQIEETIPKINKAIDRLQLLSNAFKSCMEKISTIVQKEKEEALKESPAIESGKK